MDLGKVSCITRRDFKRVVVMASESTPSFVPQRFAVSRDGASGSYIKFRASQLSQSVLSAAFDLVPTSISLVSDDGDMETADGEGNFPTHGMDPVENGPAKVNHISGPFPAKRPSGGSQSGRSCLPRL